MILPVLIAMIAGWINCHQQQVIIYLQEENRIFKARLGTVDGSVRRVPLGQTISDP